MCGIHGIINRTPNTGSKAPYERYIEEGFVVNAVRGMDSAGIFQIDKTNSPYMHKQALPGPQYIDVKAAKAFFRDVGSTVVTVGHVRAATAGKVTADNAHPFLASKPNGSRIIGVHNGTLVGWQQKQEHSKYEVDSDFLYSRIAKFGTEAFKMFNGAFALVWWDEDAEGKLFTARNKERPLWFGQTKDKKVILFASEPGMISWLAERHGIELQDTLWQTEENKLYTFDYTKEEITWTKEALPAYDYKFQATYQYPSNTNNNTHQNRGGDWGSRTGQGQSCNTSNMGMCGLEDWEGDGEGYGVMGWSRRHVAAEKPDSFPLSAQNFVRASKGVLNVARQRRYVAEGRAADFEKEEYDDLGQTEQRDDGQLAVELDRAKGGPDLKEQSKSNKAKRREKRKEKLKSKKQLQPKPSALATAVKRVSREATSSVIPTTIVEEAVTDRCNKDWYSTSGATTIEHRAAVAMNVLGELEFVKGKVYEPETSELIGDIETFVRGEGRKKFCGIVRGLSAQAADQHFVNNTEGGAWCAVIGLAHRRDLGGKVYILSPLNEKGIAALKRLAA